MARGQSTVQSRRAVQIIFVSVRRSSPREILLRDETRETQGKRILRFLSCVRAQLNESTDEKAQGCASVFATQAQ